MFECILNGIEHWLHSRRISLAGCFICIIFYFVGRTFLIWPSSFIRMDVLLALQANKSTIFSLF